MQHLLGRLGQGSVAPTGMDNAGLLTALLAVQQQQQQQQKLQQQQQQLELISNLILQQQQQQQLLQQQHDDERSRQPHSAQGDSASAKNAGPSPAPSRTTSPAPSLPSRSASEEDQGDAKAGATRKRSYHELLDATSAADAKRQCVPPPAMMHNGGLDALGYLNAGHLAGLQGSNSLSGFDGLNLAGLAGPSSAGGRDALNGLSLAEAERLLAASMASSNLLTNLLMSHMSSSQSSSVPVVPLGGVNLHRNNNLVESLLGVPAKALSGLNMDMLGGADAGRKSAYRGVIWDKNSRAWRAKLSVKGKLVHVGLFEDEREAAIAWDKKALEVRGHKTRLNFPHLAGSVLPIELKSRRIRKRL